MAHPTGWLGATDSTNATTTGQVSVAAATAGDANWRWWGRTAVEIQTDTPDASVPIPISIAIRFTLVRDNAGGGGDIVLQTQQHCAIRDGMTIAEMLIEIAKVLADSIRIRVRISAGIHIRLGAGHGATKLHLRLLNEFFIFAICIVIMLIAARYCHIVVAPPRWYSLYIFYICIIGDMCGVIPILTKQSERMANTRDSLWHFDSVAWILNVYSSVVQSSLLYIYMHVLYVLSHKSLGFY